MKIFFIDETDKQRDSDKLRAYFVLCGLILDSEDLIKIGDELGKILEENNIKSLKSARKERIDKEKKYEITRGVFSILKKYNAEVRATYFGERIMKSNQEISDTYFGALDFLLERFFLTLKKENSTGLVVMDNINHKTEAILKKKFYKFISNEYQSWFESWTKDPYRKRICPYLLFSDDDKNILLQATDLIAASLNNAIWNNGSKDLNIENLYKQSEYLNIYWPLFAKSSTGKISGWGIKIWD